MLAVLAIRGSYATLLTLLIPVKLEHCHDKVSHFKALYGSFYVVIVLQGLALGVKYFYSLNPDFLLQIINDYLVYAPTEVCTF